MGRRYSGYGAAAVGTNKTILNVFPAATTVRPSLYDVLVGCAATPADQAASFICGRHTALGTEGSGFTPVALDPANPASVADCGVAHSAEPTYTANLNLLQFSLNQRATFRWVAAPGSELISPVTASNGIGLYSLSATGTASHSACFLFSE